jgi:hypothetical protein
MMLTDDYNVGDKVFPISGQVIGSIGIITRKSTILHVRWSDYTYTEYITDTPENGFTIKLALPYIRD